jgi:hypothetical protein
VTTMEVSIRTSVFEVRFEYKNMRYPGQRLQADLLSNYQRLLRILASEKRTLGFYQSNSVVSTKAATVVAVSGLLPPRRHGRGLGHSVQAIPLQGRAARRACEGLYSWKRRSKKWT